MENLFTVGEELKCLATKGKDLEEGTSSSVRDGKN